MKTKLRPRTPKTARLEARITAEQKSLLERAAACQGRTVSDFVVQTLQQAAEAVLRNHEILQLDRNQSRILVNRLVRPPKPTAALLRAVREYGKPAVSR